MPKLARDATAIVVQRDLGGGGDHREIAVPPAHLDESRSRARLRRMPASGFPPGIRRASAAVISGPVKNSAAATLARAVDRAQHHGRAEHLRHERQLRRRIGMREAAADGAAVAGLRVADPGERLPQERHLLRERVVALDHALPRARAGAREARLDGDELERGDLVDVYRAAAGA